MRRSRSFVVDTVSATPPLRHVTFRLPVNTVALRFLFSLPPALRGEGQDGGSLRQREGKRQRGVYLMATDSRRLLPDLGQLCMGRRETTY